MSKLSGFMEFGYISTNIDVTYPKNKPNVYLFKNTQKCDRIFRLFQFQPNFGPSLPVFFSHCTKVFDRNLFPHQSVFMWYFKTVDKMEFDIFFLVELISLFCHKELLMDDKTKKELKVTKVPYFYDDD